MARQQTRRSFLHHAAAGAAISLSEWALTLFPLSPVSAEEGQVTPELVRFGPDMEPVVRLIEETPHEKCVAALMEQLRRGLPYRNFLAALYLAAIRAAKWHGGFHGYDHNAYVVHSAHQLALDLPFELRLLPAFHALDNFKGMQKAYPNRPGTPVFRGRVPAAEKATSELHAAMEEWDPDRAERAIVSMVRSQGAQAVLEPLWRYAGRDWGFIGHMAILVANSCRLLETIGWREAEPVLRYVVAGLAGWGEDHAGHSDVRPYWGNLSRVETAAPDLPGDWAEATGNEGLTTDLIVLIRESKPDESCDLAVRNLMEGKAKAGAVWDAIHLIAGELMLAAGFDRQRTQRSGDALHANTAANALHYAFRASSRADTRLLLTLQGLAWMHLYRRLIREKQLLDETIDITRLPGGKLPDSSQEAIDQVLATRTDEPHHAAGLALSLAERPAGKEQLLRAARALLARKASGDPHDIKFPVAIFEDLDLISPAWQPRLLAASVYSFWGSDRPDNPVMQRVLEAAKAM